MYMRKTILGAASAIALASPAVAADLPVPAPYSQAPGYQSYEYRTAPPVVVEEPAPPVVIERRVVIAPPPVMVEQYPVYAARECTRTPVRFGVTGGAGAIDIAFTADGKKPGRLRNRPSA